MSQWLVERSRADLICGVGILKVWEYTSVVVVGRGSRFTEAWVSSAAGVPENTTLPLVGYRLPVLLAQTYYSTCHQV